MTHATGSTGAAGERSAVAIIGSAGAISALIELLPVLPPSFPLPIVISQHLAPSLPSILPNLLSWRARLPVKWAEPAEILRGGIVYLAPPGCSLEIGPSGFAISRLPSYARAWLPCPDRLLRSLSDYYGSGAIGVVLSGMMPVGIAGLREIQRGGGITIAQSERSSSFFDMPAGAIDHGRTELILSPKKIAEALIVIADEVSRSLVSTPQLANSPPHGVKAAHRELIQ